jgi:hypothetical protein
VGCRYLGKLPQLGFLIIFDKIFSVNLINHNLSGDEISASSYILIFWGIFRNNQHFRSGNWHKRAWNCRG